MTKTLDATRIRAAARKEMRDYRRKRSIVVTMAVFPIIFLIEPVLNIFLLPASTSSSGLDHAVILPLLYMLLIPVIVPSTLSAYTVVGEREQGTLEPLLTTPIRTMELILGKAAAVMIPSVTLSYVVFGLFLAAVRLFAESPVASAVFHQGPVLLVLFLFAPLLAGWAIVVGMAISVRASEVRVAQQLGNVGELPASRGDHLACHWCDTSDVYDRRPVYRRTTGYRRVGLANRVGGVRSRTPRDRCQSQMIVGRRGVLVSKARRSGPSTRWRTSRWWTRSKRSSMSRAAT